MTTEPVAIKLTKKAFLSSQEGAYLVSNVRHSPRQAVFEEIIVPTPKRAEQWGRIVAAEVDQRACWIFKSQKEYQTWLEKVCAMQKP